MSNHPNKQEITSLLERWSQDEEAAREELADLVYAKLHAMAASYMRRERMGHTLQATALVNESFAMLMDADVNWRDRSHFFAVAATQMRRILVDHARARKAKRRGGGASHVDFSESLLVSDDPDPQILDLDRALDSLSMQDRRKARLVELHYFGGLNYAELARTEKISEATVHRELRLAKAWLNREMTL